MGNDFDRWNKHKKRTHETTPRPYYHAREMWWCSVGVNVGNELDGTGKEYDRRPFNAETFFGIALIGHERTGRYYFPLGIPDPCAARALRARRPCRE